MKLSAHEQEQLVQLLTRVYFDIAAIETEFQLLISDADFRPRIEYFHDTVRIFTAGNVAQVTVAQLAYDLSALRYIYALPLSPFQPHAGVKSPSKEVLAKKPGELSEKPKRPDRTTKERLSELYQYYAILFSALFKPAADNDCKDRCEQYHQDIQNVQALLAQVEATAKVESLLDTANHIEDEILRAQLQHFLHGGGMKKPDEVKKLKAQLAGEVKKKKKNIGILEKAHADYGLAQLGIYENGRDIVKKMAAQGMNLAGQFVESAMAETRREMGR